MYQLLYTHGTACGHNNTFRNSSFHFLTSPATLQSISVCDPWTLRDKLRDKLRQNQQKPQQKSSKNLSSGGSELLEHSAITVGLIRQLEPGLTFIKGGLRHSVNTTSQTQWYLAAHDKDMLLPILLSDIFEHFLSKPFCLSTVSVCHCLSNQVQPCSLKLWLMVEVLCKLF